VALYKLYFFVTQNHCHLVTVLHVVALNSLIQLNIQTSNIDSSLEGGAQKQQMFNIECLYDFTEPPVLMLHFL